jgi:hypothetical protein
MHNPHSARAISLLILCLTPLSAQFRAGAARRDITPGEPVPMWGYGDRHDKLSTGTLDPLFADALVIDAGGKKLAIVGLDLGRAPSERSLQIIRKRINDEAGIEYSFIAGSHTHNGPVLELSDEPGKGQGKFDASLRYYKQLEGSIVAAIVEADKKLTPARFATASVQLDDWNVNRHTKIEPKPVERELAIMRFDDAATGKPIAIVVNWTGHPTTIPSSVLRFSADYVGALKNEVTGRTGAATIFMQGAAGDQSVVKDKGTEGYGRALAGEVVKLASNVKTEEVAKPTLVVKEDRFAFPSRVDFSNPTVNAAYGRAFFPELIPNFIDEYAAGVRPRLTVALLNGNIAMIGVSGEFFSNHSIRLKQRARVKQLFFFGYSNGYHQYFPTIEAVAEGGYGADQTVSPVAVGAGEQLMNTALIWLYQMLKSQ